MANTVLDLFNSSINLESATIFNYFESKISLSDLKNNFDIQINDFQLLLNNSIDSSNFECIQKITDFIVNEYPNSDFSNYLIKAAKLGHVKVCQFFIDRKVTLNESKILQNYQYFLIGNEKFIQSLINCFNSNTKENLSKQFLKKSIKIGKKDIVDLLISKDLLNKEALFDAVKSRDICIVDKVLQFNDKPWFINQISKNGSALCIAVSNNDIEIVQRLLKLDKINVNLYEQTNGETQLTLAISRHYIEIAKILIAYPNTDINMKNNDFKSPLIIAVSSKLIDIVSLLIENEKFDPEESELDYAFYLSDGKIADQLISVEGLDVNYKYEPLLFETTLYHANYYIGNNNYLFQQAGSKIYVHLDEIVSILLSSL